MVAVVVERTNNQSAHTHISVCNMCICICICICKLSLGGERERERCISVIYPNPCTGKTPNKFSLTWNSELCCCIFFALFLYFYFSMGALIFWKKKADEEKSKKQWDGGIVVGRAYMFRLTLSLVGTWPAKILKFRLGSWEAGKFPVGATNFAQHWAARPLFFYLLSTFTHATSWQHCASKYGYHFLGRRHIKKTFVLRFPWSILASIWTLKNILFNLISCVLFNPLTFELITPMLPLSENHALSVPKQPSQAKPSQAQTRDSCINVNSVNGY